MSTNGPPYALIAIGRNEGERLKQCLRSAKGAAVVIYVDSGSKDGSVGWAKGISADVIELDRSLPFTAARARNEGFTALRKLVPQIKYVQFIDGDCELNREWPEHAIGFLEKHPAYGAACGRLRERFPERSIYNSLCDNEWDTPIGDVLACGGIVMMRVEAFEQVEGFRTDLIAGEEPELCIRLRFAGWRIRRLDFEMAKHDANMTKFRQWWRRMVRSGYAYAHGAALHGRSSERHQIWESARAWLWAGVLPSAIIAALLAFGLRAWPFLLLYPVQFLKQSLRTRGTMNQRLLISTFQMLARFAELSGQILYLRNRILMRQPKAIEYK